MFRPRVALASLSGEADARWALAAADHVGCAFLGGIALDNRTREAARRMVARDRTEFLPEDVVAFVTAQLDALENVAVRPGVNVRAVALEPLERVAGLCADHEAVLEINAHCRQDEMCAAGAGETLLRDLDRLRRQVTTAAETGANVSVKVRAGVPDVDLVAVARVVNAAGGDAIHVDAMDSEPVVADVADATDLFVIANNGVRDTESAREYLRYGADAVSVGRASDDPEVLRSVADETEEWFSRGVQT